MIKDSFPTDLQFTDDILSYIPAQTLNKLWKDLMISASYYLKNMPYPDRHLLIIADNNIT